MAGNAADCSASEECLDDGRCHYNAATRKCDEGNQRVNDDMFWSGVAVVIVGGASTAVGALLLVTTFLQDISCDLRRAPCLTGWQHEARMYSGEALVIAGPVIALGLGVPLAVIGAHGVPHKHQRPSVAIGPSGVALHASF